MRKRDLHKVRERERNREIYTDERERERKKDLHKVRERFTLGERERNREIYIK